MVLRAHTVLDIDVLLCNFVQIFTSQQQYLKLLELRYKKDLPDWM